jgi:flagellar motor switch protein FliG
MKDQKLKGVEKAAILMITLGAERAAQIYKHLNEDEIEKVSLQISQLRAVSPDVKLEVLREVYDDILAREYVEQGGFDFAKSALANALGEDEARRILERVRRSLEGNPFEFLDKADPEQLIVLLENEHPQVISLILANLSPEQASAVLQGLPDDVRYEVIKRIANMESITPDVLELLRTSLKTRISTMMSGTSKVGGPELVAEILNRVESNVEKSVLGKLEEEDPELAEQVKNLMFVFDDFMLLDDRDLQKVIRSVKDNRDIALALKGATKELQEKFFKNMSQRAALMIKEDMEVMGRVPLREVEAAQQRVIQAAKELDEAGEIVLQRRGAKEEVFIT